VPVPDAWSVDGTVVRAIGRRWLWVHLSANHYDGEQLINRRSGHVRHIRDLVGDDRYAVRLHSNRVIDRDSASGTRALCARSAAANTANRYCSSTRARPTRLAVYRTIPNEFDRRLNIARLARSTRLTTDC
jgi:hypothetical protein